MEKLFDVFLLFQNKHNTCWLDAALSIIVHNRTFKEIVSQIPDSQINSIISKHYEAMVLLNRNVKDNMKQTRELLIQIQQSTFQYLQKFSNFKEGVPDSTFCALLNLFYNDASNIREQITTHWFWMNQCNNCGNIRKRPSSNSIITLPKVKSFQPECPTSVYVCSCKTKQEMKVIYRLLPPCIIFHFENGAGEGRKIPLSFSVKERTYQLTAVVILEKFNSPTAFNHFVTYIRDPSLNIWLDCNDLQTKFVSFSSKKPLFSFKDAFMYVFEAFDDLGQLPTKFWLDSGENVEKPIIDLIDLADEADETSLRNMKVLSSGLNESAQKKPMDEESLVDEAVASKTSLRNMKVPSLRSNESVQKEEPMDEEPLANKSGVAKMSLKNESNEVISPRPGESVLRKAYVSNSEHQSRPASVRGNPVIHYLRGTQARICIKRMI